MIKPVEETIENNNIEQISQSSLAEVEEVEEVLEAALDEQFEVEEEVKPEIKINEVSAKK